MKRYSLLFLVPVTFICLPAVAQQGFDRHLKLAAKQEIYITDSLTIIPESVRIIPPEGTGFIMEPDSAGIKIKYTGTADSLSVTYSTLPYNLARTYYNRPLSEYDSSNSMANLKTIHYRPVYEPKVVIFHADDLRKSGAISRGISIGNSQSLYVNSVFNLQMEGRLSESLKIRASITDQNIPYQPEGNTVLVQDFDNVDIELYNDKFSLLGGDMTIVNPDSYFMRYRRNVMGARFRTKYTTGKTGNAETSLAVSAAKGRFASYTIKPMDGVMGPYRLYGPGNEKFIIVLANSEKVYLDGQLLQRGFNNDYVIDYNTAEITFTSSVLITKYSRIVVDFEYNDQSYGRSLIALNQNQQIGKLNINVGYFREKDDPGQSFTLPLSNRQKIMLAGLKDSGDYGILAGGDSVGYDPGKLLYKMTDTVDFSGRRISIYQYTESPDSGRYQVYFSKVGENKGNYRKRIITSGESVYDWVFPAGGIPQGNYEPMRKIPLPEKKEMVTVTTSYAISDFEKISSEFALSGFKNNLFASGKPSVNGNAVRFGIESKDRPLTGNGGLLYDGDVDISYAGSNFRPLDRYRPVEFDRDWSYDPSADSSYTPDLVFNIQNGIHGKHGYINHRLSRRVKTGIIAGWQNQVDGSVDIAGLNVSGDMYLMNNQMSFFHSNWLRYHIQAQYRLGYFVPGYRYTSDRNVIYDPANDSITASQMNYDEHLFFIRNSDSLKTRFNIQYSIRKDRAPYLGELQDYDHSNTLGFNVEHGNASKGKIGIGLFLRKLTTYMNSGSGDKTLNGKIEWLQPMLKDHLRSELTYSVGSGRELKKEYTYIEVPGGQGTHTWRDDNGDGIKQLDEFYPAINDDERNYIKIYIPSDEYIEAFDNLLNYRLSAEMPESWSHSGFVADFLSRFSNVLSISADQKNSTFGLISHILDNSVSNFDPDIIAQHGRLRNTFYFNRKVPGFGMDLTYNLSNSKNLYSQGFEGRSSKDIIVNSRVSIQRQYSAVITYDRGSNINGSDYLSGRNYAIRSDQVNTSLSWQPTNFYRITANISRTDKQNTGSENSGESSTINEAGMIFRISQADKKAIEFRFRFSKIDFTGDKNSPAGYELLNGLQPGNNSIWSVNWQQKLINGLQMDIIYEGRKSGDLRVIHTGRMQVTALF